MVGLELSDLRFDRDVVRAKLVPLFDGKTPLLLRLRQLVFQLGTQPDKIRIGLMQLGDLRKMLRLLLGAFCVLLRTHPPQLILQSVDLLEAIVELIPGGREKSTNPFSVV